MGVKLRNLFLVFLDENRLQLKKNLKIVTIPLILVFMVLVSGCEDKYVAKGHKIFSRYCSPCHGMTGEGNGYNAVNLDPSPRDLTDGSEEYMVKLDNEEILEVLQVGGRGVDLSPSMPVWGKVFSEEELWSLIAFVRTLHPYEGEEIVFTQPDSEEGVFDKKRPRFKRASEKRFFELKDELVPDEDAFGEQVSLGEELFQEYGCIGCHVINGEGGKLGPDLSRAGFMLQTPFIYRWILYPQSFKPKTRMANLDLTEEDALAVALYLSTQRAPAPGSGGILPVNGNDAVGILQ